MVPEILPNGNHENHTLDAIISYSQNASWGKSRHSLHICSRTLTIQMQKKITASKKFGMFLTSDQHIQVTTVSNNKY